MTGRQALHAGGQDAAHPALRLAPGLLLDLPHELGGVVARLRFHLPQQDLPRLRLRERADSLQLAQVVPPSLAKLLFQPVRVSLAVHERLLAAREIGQLRLQRLLALEHALLDPHDLAATLTQLVFELAAKPAELFEPFSPEPDLLWSRELCSGGRHRLGRSRPLPRRSRLQGPP